MTTPMRSRFAAMNARASSARRNSSVFSGSDDAFARLPTIAVAASASFFSVSAGVSGRKTTTVCRGCDDVGSSAHFLRRLRCFEVLLRNRFDRGRQVAGDRARKRFARVAAGDEIRGTADEERERLPPFVERRRAFGERARTARRCFVLAFRGAIELVRGLREQRDRERFLRAAADVGIAVQASDRAMSLRDDPRRRRCSGWNPATPPHRRIAVRRSLPRRQQARLRSNPRTLCAPSQDAASHRSTSRAARKGCPHRRARSARRSARATSPRLRVFHRAHRAPR